MNTINVKELAKWIEDIKEAAKEDNSFSIAWFKETEDKPFSIIAGWQKMNLPEDLSSIFCTSKSQPEYTMCVKIAVNDGPYAYTDFEAMDMPLNEFGDVDDTCIPLEWDDLADSSACFFSMECERTIITMEISM